MMNVREQQIIKEIHNSFSYCYSKCYKLLKEFYISRKERNPKYTYSHLSKDIKLSNSTVYRIMSWEDATKESKLYVKQHKINRAVLCRLLHRMTMKFAKQPYIQNYLIKHYIKNNLTVDKMEIFIDKYLLKKLDYTLKNNADKVYQRWHFIRDFKRYHEHITLLMGCKVSVTYFSGCI